MIVIIDTDKDKSFHSKYKNRAASFIGISSRTLFRWIKEKDKPEKYNHLKIYLESEEL